MDVTAALFTVAVTVGSLGSGPALSLPSRSTTIAAAIEQSAPLGQRMTEPSGLQRLATPRSSTRPAALIPLYSSLVVLQGWDIYATTAALNTGATEANPLMKPVAGRNAAAVAVKAAATAGSIYFTERAWKQSRKGAVILMTAINVATAAVVAHNTQVARRK